MNNKLNTCKACGQEIAKSANTCPHCGAKNKKGHPLLIVILSIIILIAIIGSMGGDGKPTKVEPAPSAQTQTSNNTETQPTKKEEGNTFRVGETAKLNDIMVSLISVTKSTGSAYNTPTEGNVFVLCEFEIANNSSREIAVSSMMSFEAYCDDYTCTTSFAALMEKGNKNQLDGTVASGKKFNGVIGYEIPTNWQELEIHFTPDFWSGKDIVFIATND